MKQPTKLIPCAIVVLAALVVICAVVALGELAADNARLMANCNDGSDKK
jgi:hypothetical protein